MRFEKFIDCIFKNEGFYVNDPSDNGGETKYGISKNAYPNLDIKNLTIDQAKVIYKHDYYDKCKAGAIENELLSLHVFDMAVNAGISRASKMLQKIAGVEQDGIIGNKTLSMINGYDYSEAYIQERIKYYNRIAESGNNKKFLKGWLNRVTNTTNFLNEKTT